MKKLQRRAEKQHGVFTLGDAWTCGVTSDALYRATKAGRFERLGRGVYRIVGTPRTFRQQLYAAVAIAGPGAAASHRSAAALWRVPGFREGPIEVLRPGHRSKVARLGALRETSLLPPSQTRLVDSIRVTDPSRTIFDLAAVYGSARRGRVERAAAWSISNGLTSFPRLRVVLAEVGVAQRRGTAALREMLERLDDGAPLTESELEELVLVVLARAGLPMPRRQVQVGDTTAPVGRVDFVYEEAQLVIEADSRRHHSSWLEIEADRRRDARLLAGGWMILRVTWRELCDEPELVTAAVQSVLARCAEVPPLTISGA